MGTCVGAISIKKGSIVDPKQIDELVVINWGPRSTEQGKSFNVQPSGKSAIWIEVDGLLNSPDTKVLFGGRPMEDICIHDLGVNAAIPTSYLTDIGTKNVVIEDYHSGKVIFVGEFSIVSKVKLTPNLVHISLEALISSYYAAHNFLSDTKQFPDSITQDQLRLFEQGLYNLERLLSHFIPGLNSFLLSCRAVDKLIESMDSDPAASEQWSQFCVQVERLKIIMFQITRALNVHNPIETTFHTPLDSQETEIAYKGKSSATNKRHNLELMYLETSAGITMPLSTPSHLLFSLTNRCNYRCRTCYQSDHQNFVYNDLSTRAIKNLLPFLPSCNSANIAGAGEPLLSRSTPVIIKMLSDYGVLTDLVTNGSLLSRLKGIAQNIDHILISLDGASSETVDTIRFGGQFNRIIAHIQRLPKEIHRKIIFNIAVCRANVHEIHKLVQLAKKLGIAGVGLQQFNDYLPWHATMKLLAKDQPLLMQQIRASRKELEEQGQEITTSLIVECETHDEDNRQVIKPDYKKILKMLDQVQTPIESAAPLSWRALAQEFQDATLLKLPKELLSTLAMFCEGLKHDDSMQAGPESQDTAIGSRRDNLVLQLNKRSFIRFPHCLAPYTLMNIHDDSTVKPCCIIDLRCGSLTTDSANGVWHSPAYLRLRRAFATGLDLPEECTGCRDGVRFAQATQLITNAKYMGVDISKIQMPTDGCVPNRIMDMVIPHAKSISTELLINPYFTSSNGFNLYGSAKYDDNSGIVTEKTDSPVSQYVTASAKDHCSITILARFIKIIAKFLVFIPDRIMDMVTPIIMDMVTPHAKSIRFRKIIIAINSLINSHFKSVIGWRLYGDARYDANAGIVTANADSPVSQDVTVFAGEHYLNIIVARSIKKGVQGRIQINWLDGKARLIRCDSQDYKCSLTWAEHSMEAIAPPKATEANIYVNGHSSIPVEFKSCSFRQLIF